jgi:hypothetical protein
MCVLEHDYQTGRLLVAEYGQPGGHIKQKTLVNNGGRLYCGARMVKHVLRLDDVLIQAEERNELV